MADLFVGMYHTIITYRLRKKQNQSLALLVFRYYKSLIGRDFKLWAQIGIFVVWSLLTQSEKEMWLSLAKVSLVCTYAASY